ncbi:MAG: hypothetical protein HFF89_00430 [Oscillibacter sp.]|nr:hypothetical protein [Oscillibacter sp.]MCI8691073.1 hypothetical protein [Oscillibacter sp.]
MVGLILWTAPQKGRKRVTIREQAFLHMRFLCAEVERSPHGTVLRRRVLSAGKKLRKQGVARVVLPEDFSYGEQLEACGLRPVPTLGLRRALAADWVRAGLAERGLPAAGARVAVSAAGLTGEVVRTVTELALRHRYVLLDLSYGGEELCRQLRREYGVSLLLGPSRDQLAEAEALILFDARSDLSARNPVTLRLYDEEFPLPPLSLPPALEERVPEGVNQGQMLAALREAGAIQTGQISIGTGRAVGT